VRLECRLLAPPGSQGRRSSGGGALRRQGPAERAVQPRRV